jgi:predicted O-methyltransferase YrrM
MAKVTVNWVKAALQQADNERSKIGERERELFGLSSIRLKCLVNNLCAASDNLNYLEIGTYKGSTLISALVGNPKTKAVGVDSFRYDDREPKKWAPNDGIWENVKSQLYSNINRYKDPDSGVNTDNITILEQDFKTIDWAKQPKFDVCFFDVSPVNAEIYDAFFEQVTQALAPESIVIFSSYSNELHAKELQSALIRHEDKVTVQTKEQRISSGLSDSTAYYSGILIASLKKKVIKTNAN